MITQKEILIRILTIKEMRDNGTISDEEARPKDWESIGEMDYTCNKIYLAKVESKSPFILSVIDEHRSYHKWYYRKNQYEILDSSKYPHYMI